MKNAKKLVLITTSIIIAGMIILYSCKSYTGPGKRNIFEEGGDYILPANFLSQEEQYSPMDPDSQARVLFTNECKIPALTISSRGTLIAAVGCGTTKGKLIGKRSSDFGKTWTEFTAFVDDANPSSYVHPFFINCHNGDILLGISTTNLTENKTSFYRSTTDGSSWTKENNAEINLTNICANATSAFVTYGQGVTLRHGTNKSLLFPYFYSNAKPQSTSNKKGRFTATMISTNDGRTWKQHGADYGSFATSETKFIESSDGKILLNMRADAGNQIYWMVSENCGETWDIKTSGTAEQHSESHADLIRYEFNGKDIKSGSGSKYALITYSDKQNKSYGVKMTVNDFNGGAGSFNSKYIYNKLIASNLTDANDIYPAITVLPDGTIATLAEETNNMVFRRFNLSWLSGEEEYIDYDIDNILK